MDIIISLACTSIMCIVFLIIIDVSRHKKQKKNVAKALRCYEFKPVKVIMDGDFYLAKDDFQHFLFVSEQLACSSLLFNYADIISINLSENGNDIIKKSISGTIAGSLIGGVLGGGVGAIIGGLSSTAKTGTEIRSINIHIILRNQIVPSINLEFLSGCVKKGDFSYKLAYDKAQSVLDALTIAMDEAKHDSSIFKGKMNYEKDNNRVKPQPNRCEIHRENSMGRGANKNEGMKKNGYPSISYGKSRTIISEGIQFEPGSNEKGGFIVFSTDVNAKELSPGRIANWISQKIATFGDMHWTIGHYLDGRYRAKNGQNYGKNSLSLMIVGVDTDGLIEIAKEIRTEFQQESVLLKDFSIESILFVDNS